MDARGAARSHTFLQKHFHFSFHWTLRPSSHPGRRAPRNTGAQKLWNTLQSIWEGSHSLQVTSKGLRAFCMQICLRVLCERGLRKTQPHQHLRPSSSYLLLYKKSGEYPTMHRHSQKKRIHADLRLQPVLTPQRTQAATRDAHSAPNKIQVGPAKSEQIKN